MTQTIVSYAAVIVYRLKIYTPFSSPLSIVTFLESSWWRSIATQKKDSTDHSCVMKRKDRNFFLLHSFVPYVKI